MKRFFNIIPGDGECCILLHGIIGDYDAVRSGDITRELLEAEAAYRKIDVRINSGGGDVHSGIAIFNAIRNSKAEITMYVDGIAASMASVIALCGKPVYMSKYARLMIHGVSGGCWGNKTEIQEAVKEIESLETTLCDMYAGKTGKTADEIRAAYFDGKDHWLTAAEALELGFIDGVYDADPIPEDSTPEQVYAHFQNKYNSSLKTEDMTLEQLKKLPSFAACATDEDVLKKVGELEAEAAKAATLEKEKNDLQTRVDGYAAAEQAAVEAEIDKEVDTAYDEGRCTDPERSHFKALLRKDHENGKAILDARPVKRRVVNELDKKGGQSADPWAEREKEIRDSIKK